MSSSPINSRACFGSQNIQQAMCLCSPCFWGWAFPIVDAIVPYQCLGMFQFYCNGIDVASMSDPDNPLTACFPEICSMLSATFQLMTQSRHLCVHRSILHWEVRSYLLPESCAVAVVLNCRSWAALKEQKIWTCGRWRQLVVCLPACFMTLCF